MSSINEIVAQYMPMAVLLIGVLAFVVSVITELTKEMALLKRIPTDVQVLVLSIALALVVFFGYATYTLLVVRWYMVVGAVVTGFFVAFVAMYGWAKLSALWQRFNTK